MNSQNADFKILDNTLSGSGLMLGVGNVLTNIAISFPSVREDFLHLYQDYPLRQGQEIVDYRLKIYAQNLFRRFIRRQASVETWMNDTFIPMPEAMGALAIEMGMNWHMAFGCKTHILFHAGVVEKDNVGIIIPAISGSGKSTLSAGLSYSGWRFFTDEFGMLNPEDGLLYPYPRPVSLKNQSIAVMKNFVGDQDLFSREYHSTPKGTISYLRPPASSIEQMTKPAKPRLVIHPVYNPDAKPEIRPLTQTMGFFRLVKSSANYGDIGEQAFRALTKVAEECQSFEIAYSSLDQAIALVNQIVDENIP